jgi:hypothetical protein
VTFEEQVATHGGLGGPQLRAFIAWPPQRPLAPETLDDSLDLYPYFVQHYLGQPPAGEPDERTADISETQEAFTRSVATRPVE